MGPGPGVPAIVPSAGPCSRPLLPSTGSRGAGSPASAVLREAPTPERPSRRASLPSLGGTSRAPLVRSHRRATRRRRAWALVYGPQTDFSLGDAQASQVPGEPSCVHALLFDPGEISVPGPPGTSMQPSAQSTASALATIRLTGLHPTACTLPVYASQPGSLPHHATLGSGWWPTFAGRGSPPQGSTEGFRHHEPSMASSSSRFSWRTDRI
jgi:hypothetical protein